MQLCQGPYFYLHKVLLPISSRVVHKYILHDFGECCKSVPLDHPGSYVSISIKYITIILAHVVQVDAFYCESLSCYICIVIVVGCCTSCVELEYLVFLTRIAVMQGLFMGDLYWSSLANSLTDYDWCNLLKRNCFWHGVTVL